MENGLFGEFTKKREVEQTLGFFPVDQQVQFLLWICQPWELLCFRDFSERGRAARLGLGVLDASLLVSTQTVSSYPADSSSHLYQPHPENPTKDLKTSPNSGRISPSFS